MKTLEDCFNELEKYKGEFTIFGNWIRHKTMLTFDGDHCCPLNVLCNGLYENNFIQHLTQMLDMESKDVYTIVAAADDPNSKFRKKLEDTVL